MMNVVLCGNDHVYPGIELVVYSLLTHNKNVNIYIFTMNLFLHYKDGTETKFAGLTPWQVGKLRKIVRYLDKNSNICFIDVADEYMKYLSGSINEESGFTPYASLRLIADIVLPDVDHILYLDCDTAIQSNIEDMYMDCLKGDKDCYASYAYGACQGYGEMVSGVMVMKLKALREKKLLEKARQLYKKYLYKYPDQMALRDSIPYIGRLPETYGYIHELESCGYTPAILHFTNDLVPKIYSRDYSDTRVYFYKRFPFLKYVKEGCELLDKINFTL